MAEFLSSGGIVQVKGFFSGCLFLFVSFVAQSVNAEGSFQAGLNQPFLEYGAVVVGYTHNEPLHVDILTAGEVINISLCGNVDAHNVRAEVYNPSGILVGTYTHDHGNVTCNDPFTAPLPLTGPQGDQGPFQYITPSAGTYLIRLYNAGFSGSNRELIRRFDVTVTADASIRPDPAAQAGRLWSREWGFWTQSFDKSAATDADYYPLVPGGRLDTNYVWKLDLNDFSGAWYTLVANSIGVAVPRSGYSVPETGNSATSQYPIYLSYPVVANLRPSDPPKIMGLKFTDNEGQDYGISPGTTSGVQDSGIFEFMTDISGTYAFVIDTNNNGQFGANDTLLLGSVIPGLNKISWAGTDADGTILPSGIYDTQLRVSLGEYHFVARDAETSGGRDGGTKDSDDGDDDDGKDKNENGLTIFLANADGTTNNTQVYWDDATFLSSFGGTTTLPNGASSATSAGRHTWGDFKGSGIGNEQYIDTYVYGLTVNATIQVAIVSDDAPLIGNNGSVAFSGSSLPGDAIVLTVIDPDLNTNTALVQSVAVQVVNDNSGEQEQIVLTETGPNSAVFSAAVTTRLGALASTNNDGVLNTQGGQTLTAVYYDQLNSAGTGATTRTAQIQIEFDTDNDGLGDNADLDADNDGIPDSVEGDAGIDTDGDGTPDYLDLDSDGDGIKDIIEAGGSDADGDGRVDDFTDTNNDGLDDSLAASPLLVTDNNGDGIPDYRDNGDSDGVVNSLDLDSDNDGIPDSVEGDASIDTDGDGTPDYLDLDSDNDGLFDLTESGIGDPAGLDSDNNGRIDAGNSVGTNGLADIVEISLDSGSIRYTVADTDSDGFADYRDLDSDNDGSPDASDAFPTNRSESADSDGDGLGDNADLDADNDGIPDSVEGDAGIDTDGDGTPDYLDLDSDGDGIKDIIEAGGSDADGDGRVDDFTDTNNDGLDDSLAASPLLVTDNNGDGIPDYRDNGDSDGDGVVNSLDLDSDNDGIPDSVEGDASIDTDGDGIADYLDLDSDNDGISDLIESGAGHSAVLDSDNDGRIDPANPVGDNGFADVVETSVDSGLADYNSDGNPDSPRDTDSDGTPDYRDLDSDGDGINDIIDAGGVDMDNNGRIDSPVDSNNDGRDDTLVTSPLPDIYTDSDGDGIPDYRDNDDFDRDGIADTDDLDTDNDGIPDSIEGDGIVDTDGDGVPDSRDLDSDNDGLFDLVESGITGFAALDADADGRIDVSNSVGDNGLADVLETSADSGVINDTVADTDSDGIDDYRDLDSDNDGIPDVAEADGSDPEGDGTLGSGTPQVDDNGLITGAGLNPLDSDDDGTPDQRDIDSDNDGINDLIEAGGSDADNDDQVDDFIDTNNDGLDDTLAASPLPLPDSDNNGIPDYRDNGDLDNDGIVDTIDLDTDNDGIPDSVENEDEDMKDTDGDGIPDSRDLDSDNDGLFDLAESGIADPVSLDTNDDGRIDFSYTVGNNGLADIVEISIDSGSINYTVADSDSDGVSDYRDLDSDNDGTPDATEGGRSDPDNDGRIRTGNPSVDSNGVVNGSGVTAPDSDNDGVSDYRDLDSDNDGIMDVVETGGTDSDGDGRVDDFGDANGDGLDDELGGSALNLPDSNNNGIADYRDPATAVQPKMVRTGLHGLGGCTLNPGAAFDPMLPLLLLIALLSLWRRKVVCNTAVLKSNNNPSVN